MTTVPEVRVRQENGEALNPQGAYVLYWMTAFRRLGWNYALQHAADLSRKLNKPLVVLETLSLDRLHANRRSHRFILQGLAERATALAGSGVTHYPFVEGRTGEGEGLVEALGGDAVAVVTDDFPTLPVRHAIRAAGRALRVSLEAVDSNGLLPLSAPDRTFSAAYHFRRYLQKALPAHLPETPDPDPLRLPLVAGRDPIPGSIRDRWPATAGSALEGEDGLLATLPLDGIVPPVALEGTRARGLETLERFLGGGLQWYARDRNHPDLEAASGLSPFLHSGLISSHEVFAGVAEAEGWTPLRLGPGTDGKREGWWGMGPGAEAFLDQLVTWREIGFNMSSREEGHTEFGSLPAWARGTLEAHKGDPRPHLYDLDAFRWARTHDPLWNAAQNQLLREGIIHNYLRMLWGKKILEWSASPEEALATMIQLNDGLALDGQDPNSYSGIFWCLGRYDRGWPQRPIYGKVRSMSSEATRRKVKLGDYLARFASSRE